MSVSALPRHGVLFINIGSPASLRLWSVASYLRKFLSDRRVIDINPVLRFLLVNLLIVPLRSRNSRAAYGQIWKEEGSPLLFFSHALVRALNAQLPPHIFAAVAMCYSEPSLTQAIAALAARDVERLTIMPLFPQYSSAANGAAIEAALRVVARQQNIPYLRVVNYFYDQPFYQRALRTTIADYLQKNPSTDYVLFSYHGLPRRQLPCRATPPDCCATVTANNKLCYRRQCLQTTRAVAQSLRLPANFYSTAFQSRLAGTPWIKPWSDEKVKELAQQKGVKHLAVVCPSFVADCLETLEEVGMRLRADFIERGGTELTLIPCLNDNPSWVALLSDYLCERPVIIDRD